ncbi:PEP-CTERM sorting domain-containing protein [Lacipirellula sp.]|uniref:PEP-CTERM sorting domain-containing protein n=1 Tax=Lacipirellula sp. TaxID=2691419 RepID=UPI003D14213C
MRSTFYGLATALTLAFTLVQSLPQAAADPLPGRDLLKFTQKPMINTLIPDVNGTVNTYMGHDELSTAYGFTQQPGQIPSVYQGKFMADDFADNLTSPVVHVKWWGSYKNDFIDPQMPVNKFLISFESDIPQGPNTPFSRPGTPLLNQVVQRNPAGNPLAPTSGTFAEKLIRGPDPILGESLYEYNAELHLNLDFPEKKDTVYWLKIVAMVDVVPGLSFPAGNPNASLTPVTQWGWHNRDYTQQNPLASPNVSPGETVVGQVGIGTPVWHFQDDSVAGDVRILPTTAGYLSPQVDQQNMLPQKYVDLADGPANNNAAYPPISTFSKDLAFELYTVNVPEPTSVALLACGMIAIAWRRQSIT